MVHDMNSWHSWLVDSPNVDNLLFRNFCSVKTDQMTHCTYNAKTVYKSHDMFCVTY